MISDDFKHDSHVVHIFQDRAYHFVTDHRDVKLHCIIEFTDGCPAQFKSKIPFADRSFASQDFGMMVERHFFGSRHGKNASDGVSRVVKSAVRRAVTFNRCVVTNALDMYEYLSSKLTMPPSKGDQCQHFAARSFMCLKLTSPTCGETEASRSLWKVPGCFMQFAPFSQESFYHGHWVASAAAVREVPLKIVRCHTLSTAGHQDTFPSCILQPVVWWLVLHNCTKWFSLTHGGLVMQFMVCLWTWTTLVQVVPCRLLSAKPLPKPVQSTGPFATNFNEDWT